MQSQPKAYTVTAITRMIKGSLEDMFPSVWVEGEISNYLHHSSGHRYLSLKDDRATIRVVMWRSVGNSLQFDPKNGQKVLAYGDITVYEKSGQYQLSCRKLVPVGVGPLELAFRQLHEKLSGEGLFDEDRKQALPEFPQKIGVVTSPTGAAVRDIIQIAQRRNKTVELILYPAKVQGEGAEDTIAAGIRYFNSRDDIDLMIIGRGGGSLEDLWAFNTEMVVRAVAASKIPVVSAVGHEIDTTLSDLVADLRAPTPSAAAELAVWSRREMLAQVQSNIERMTGTLRTLTQSYRQTLSALLQRRVFARPFDLISQRQQHLDASVRLLSRVGKNSFELYNNRLSLAMSRLQTLSPLEILARGYSVSRTIPDRSVVVSAGQVKAGDKIETILADGRITSIVEGKGSSKS